MPDHRIRAGSLQFYPRKRVERILPSVNFKHIKGNKLLGFIGYKVGMTSVYVKDNTADSMSKGKKIIIPATILECPELKIFSVRFYKNNIVLKDVIVGFDDELKRKIKKPKQIKQLPEIDFDDVKIIAYTNVKKTNLKKSPDMIELALSGSKEEKLKFIKEKINKEISVSEVLDKGLVDVRGTTKGKGLQGPVKRFGITLKSHKSEKGVRRPGSLAPWHPARVTFRAPQAGQTGFFHRIAYNNMIIKIGKINQEDINKKQGFHRYGTIKCDYIIIKGSVPGPKKRPLIITPSFRQSKLTSKQNYEFIELR